MTLETAVQAIDIDITNPPHYDGERLLHVCRDPFGSGAYVFPFSDGTALVVRENGGWSRWAEDGCEVRSLSAGPRCAWSWVPGPVRAEVWRRSTELDELLQPSLDR
jgi:hypothetical protein